MRGRGARGLAALAGGVLAPVVAGLVPGPAGAATPVPGMDPAVRPVSARVLGWTWRRECPLAPGHLREVSMNHWGFDGRVHRGRLVVHRDAVPAVVGAFAAGYAARFPVRSMRALPAFPGRAASERADNTAAFACERSRAGGWDPRSLGRTVDVNPVENPLVRGRRAVPAAGRAYARRTPVRRGMLVRGGPVVRAFAAAGWRWAGTRAGAGFAGLTAPAPGGAAPRVEAVTAADLPHSYRPGCPVAPRGLRRLTVNHWGLDGSPSRGELVVRAGVADDLARVFATAYARRFPVRTMDRVDLHRGRDEVSMAADNTSAFNCRKVVGNPYRLSRHSYGDAIDVNPLENPYVTGGRVYPPASRPYLDRWPYRPGMVLRGGSLAGAFAAEGWPWGARWDQPDYQHFSSTGG